MTVKVSRLANDLVVASDTMTSVESVAVGIWVGVGTRQETQAASGVAHLLEHMAFKGTARRSAYDIAAEIEAVGGQINAYTGRECTAFYARALADHLPLALDILADIIQHPLFDEQELDRERSVVLQEIGQLHDTPEESIFDQFQSTAFPGQAIGRPVLGSEESVRAIDRATLQSYLDRHYRPPNMVLSAAGKVEHGDLLRLAEAAFAGLERTGAEGVEPAVYQGGDFRETRPLEQVHLLLGVEGPHFSHPDYYAASVLSTLFGGGMSSRLFQELRERRGLVYSIYTFLSAYRDSGLFGIYAGTGAGQVPELLPVVCDEFARLAVDIDEEELERARAQLKAAILMGMESTTGRCEQLAQHILIYGRPLSVSEVVERIEAVDLAQLSGLARRLLAGRPTLATLGPIDGVENFDRVAERLERAL